MMVDMNIQQLKYSFKKLNLLSDSTLYQLIYHFWRLILKKTDDIGAPIHFRAHQTYSLLGWKFNFKTN